MAVPGPNYDPFPLDRDAAVELARRTVCERVHGARAAWLAGSVVWGGATAGSDLDVTVLAESVYRESLLREDIPIEIFVHTDASLERARAEHRRRRLPTIARLIGESVLLLDSDGAGARLAADCSAELTAGPDPLRPTEVDALRYALTGDLEDLAAATDPAVRQLLGVRVYQRAAELLLGLEGGWQGAGKRLPQRLADRDAEAGPAGYPAGQGGRLTAALRELPLRVMGLIGVTDEVLNRCGGRLFDGYRTTPEP